MPHRFILQKSNEVKRMEDANLIIDTVLLAGKIMIENGADMARGR